MKKYFMAVMLSAMALTGMYAQDLLIKKGPKIDIDGYGSNPIWEEIEPVPINRVFNGEQPTVTAWFKMYYSEKYLYLLIDVEDDVHYPSYVAEDKQPWMYDKTEVYFDVNDVLADGQGPAYLNGFMAPGHYQMAPAFEEEYYGCPYLPHDLVYGDLSDQVYVCYMLKDDNKSYRVEYEYPFEAFKNDRGENLSLEAFKNLPNGLGFDVIVVDNDNDGAGRKRAVWKNEGPVEPYNNMDACGVVRLVDEELGSSISSHVLPQLAVWLDPTTGCVEVEGEADRVEVVDLLGGVAASGVGARADVSALASGIYLVNAYRDGACVGTAKVMKK